MAETSEPGTDHRVRLEQYEKEAVDWLADRPTHHSTAALYDALLLLPYLRDLSDHHAEYVAKSEQTLTTTFCLDGTTLPLPLSPSPGSCACEDMTGLGVEKIYLSGSVREGTDVRLFAEEVSDIDVMFLLGPASVDSSVYRRGAGSQTETPQLASLSAFQQCTSQPGFTVLHHKRLPSCRHRTALTVDPRRVVGLMDSLRSQMTSSASLQTGPSVATTIKDVFRDPKSIDLVACLPCPSWPHDDFISRQRPSGYPDAELVARLCRTPAFIVPVGFKGSATEELEWRLSFSRHEYIVYRMMTANQRLCLTTLKHCRAVVGESAKPLKSYYLKTALMWLAESRAANQWTLETMHDSLLLILRYLELCLDRGYLPCYFWPEMSLLASRSSAERAELATAVAELRRRVVPAALALLADWLGQPVVSLAQTLLNDGQRMTESEFCAATAVNGIHELLSGDRRPLAVLKDLALSGKVRPYGRLPRLPLCSALSLGIEAGREFNWRTRQNPLGSQDASNVTGVLQPILALAQQIRQHQHSADSWMAEL